MTHAQAWLDENIYGYVPHPNLGLNSTCDPGEPIPDCLNAFQTFPAPFQACNERPDLGFWWVRSNWQSNFKFFNNESHGTTSNEPSRPPITSLHVARTNSNVLLARPQ